MAWSSRHVGDGGNVEIDVTAAIAPRRYVDTRDNDRRSTLLHAAASSLPLLRFDGFARQGRCRLMHSTLYTQKRTPPPALYHWTWPIATIVAAPLVSILRAGAEISNHIRPARYICWSSPGKIGTSHFAVSSKGDRRRRLHLSTSKPTSQRLTATFAPKLGDPGPARAPRRTSSVLAPRGLLLSNTNHPLIQLDPSSARGIDAARLFPGRRFRRITPAARTPSSAISSRVEDGFDHSRRCLCSARPGAGSFGSSTSTRFVGLVSSCSS